MSEGACKCGEAPKLIFACSGAADVGEVADLAARQLTREGTGKMFCLAGVGGRIPGIMKTTEAASKILAIDGCALNCVRNCLVEAGFVDFEHILVTDMGLTKGASPATPENVEVVTRRAAELLNT